MFAAAGFQQVRVSLLWGAAPYSDPSSFPADYSTNSSTASFIQAAQAAGLRPLVLLQAFDQGPCPNQLVEFTAVNAISASDTTITLSGSSGLVVDYSGLTGWVTGVTDNTINYVSSADVMCATLVTAIDGNQVTLSKPVGVDIPAGATLLMHTLLYKPWGEPGTTDYTATMDGWLSYLGSVSQFMQTTLGTTGAADLGFDIEIWNETSFGSDFLDINNYYSSAIVPETYTNGIPAVIPDILAQSSAYILANPTLFAGVGVTDGFASVSPVQASSSEPAAITALSKHPYPSPTSYPASDPGYGGLDATGAATSFIPTYTIYTHEYFSTAINPFTLARDIATETNDFGGVAHGQDARTVNGVVAPVAVWMTEIGTATANEGVTDASAIAMLTAKGTLRALVFNLGIGVERVYIYEGIGDTTNLAMVSTSAPTTPTLVLNALQAALAFMAGGVSGDQAGTLVALSYTVSFAAGGSGATLWTGGGTTGTPDFDQPTDYVLIPVQVTPKRIALLHWFSALDMRDEMAATMITLVVAGIGSAAATVTAYDPINAASVAATVTAQTGGKLTISTTATDRPFILVVEQSSKTSRVR